MNQDLIKNDEFTHTAYPWPSGDGVTLWYTPYGSTLSQLMLNFEDARELGIAPVLDIPFAALDPESYVPQKDGEQVLLSYTYVIENGKKKYSVVTPYVIRHF